MKYIVLVTTLLMLVLCIDVTRAQSIPGLSLPEVNIHSPEVVGLGKYGDYIVDPSTGVVPVNIPLYTIKTAKLGFPISLSYHASGIKVEEVASNVGLGWTLNASGVITRQIKDQPDENGVNGFMVTGQSLPNYNNVSPMPPAPGITGYADSIDAYFGGKDMEPDLFNMFTPILTGEFRCNNAGAFVSTIFDSLQYNIQLAPTNVLIVTDKTGIVYRFGTTIDGTPAWETSSSTPYTYAEYGNGADETTQFSAQTSWYLTEIISADKTDTIRFRYKQAILSDTKVISQSQNVLTSYAQPTQVYNNLYSSFNNESSTNVQIIDQILFKNGYIQFYNATDRQDLQSNVSTTELYDVRITGFAVFDNQNNMIRKVGFDNNDYFNRNGTGQSVNNEPVTTYTTKSLKLDGVEFYDQNGAFVNHYLFQYDNTPLPPRCSTALDFWGYYNGQSNANLIPQIWYNNYWTASPQSLGGNRSTNFNYMKAASLTQVTYPTGGYTQFGYEPNYYLITTPAGQSTTQAPVSMTLLALQSTGRTAGCTVPIRLSTLPANNTMTFTVNNAVVNNVATVTATFSDFEVVNNSEMTATVTDVTNGAVYSFVQGTQTMTQQVTTTQTINFYQGHTYTLTANTNAVTGSVYGYCNCPFIQLNLAYTTLDTQTTAATMIPSQAGGLRIKTITNYNIDNSVISQKIFTYGDSAYGPNQVGVGTLITDTSSNLYNFPLLIPDANKPTCQQSLYPFTWYTSNSLIDLGLNNGCAVVYSKVTEQDVSASDTSVSNGKTEYYYNNPYSYRNPLPGSKYPYYSWIYPDWGRNQLIKKIEYNLVGGIYSPVHEIDYTYQTQPENRIKTLVINEMQPELYTSWCVPDNGSNTPAYLANSQQRFFFYNFYESCGLILKTGETETFYSSNGSLTSTRTYSYNNYLDPSMVQSTDSRQNQIVTNYKYTGDLNYSTLSAAHMVSLPTFEETTINGLVRSGSILAYDSLGDVNSHYLFNQSSPTSPIPYTNYTSPPSTYEQKENLSYDPTYNNLQEIDKNYSFNTVYLWGYTGQYPIAEIKNATVTNTAYTSFESDGGNWTIPDTTRIRSAVLTGNVAYHLNGSNSITKSGLNTSLTYVISYWQDTANSVSVNGTSGIAKMTIGTWTYYEDTVHGAASVTISGTGTIDELRLYPKGSLMTTYTYAPLIGMTSQCDPSGRLTYYSYDTMGRLKLIKDQYGNILRRYDYEYQTSNH